MGDDWIDGGDGSGLIFLGRVRGRRGFGEDRNASGGTPAEQRRSFT
jgi:hypothetical protein